MTNDTTPTFAVPPGFLGIGRRERDVAISIAGIPLDIGTTNRSGARFGPQAIRHASRMLVDGAHPTAWIDISEFMLSDIGDFRIALGDIPASLKIIEDQAATIEHLVALGGDHGITLPLLRALARRRGPLALVHFDAHVDTWPDNFGQTFAHGSVFYHAIKERLVDPRRMIQIGIRSPVEREVFDWTVAQGVTVVSAEEVHEHGPKMIAGRIRSIVGAADCYLSFDIDALDPAFAPGTGTPEIGGLASWQAQSILRRLTDLHFTGMDVVEVAPAYDVAEITSLAAATMVFEYLTLAAMFRKTNGRKN
ncbi:MAG: agmatinase [Xanthobacteraceae bacterium]